MFHESNCPTCAMLLIMLVLNLKHVGRVCDFTNQSSILVLSVRLLFQCAAGIERLSKRCKQVSPGEAGAILQRVSLTCGAGFAIQCPKTMVGRLNCC